VTMSYECSVLDSRIQDELPSGILFWYIVVVCVLYSSGYIAMSREIMESKSRGGELKIAMCYQEMYPYCCTVVIVQQMRAYVLYTLHVCLPI
jgi:hypothetical protein